MPVSVTSHIGNIGRRNRGSCWRNGVPAVAGRGHPGSSMTLFLTPLVSTTQSSHLPTLHHPSTLWTLSQQIQLPLGTATSYSSATWVLGISSVQQFLMCQSNTEFWAKGENECFCHQLLCYTRDIGTKMVLSSGPQFYRVLVCGK